MNSPESARESIRVCEHFLGDDYAAVPWLCLSTCRDRQDNHLYARHAQVRGAAHVDGYENPCRKQGEHSPLEP